MIFISAIFSFSHQENTTGQGPLSSIVGDGSVPFQELPRVIAMVHDQKAICPNVYAPIEESNSQLMIAKYFEYKNDYCGPRNYGVKYQIHIRDQDKDSCQFSMWIACSEKD